MTNHLICKMRYEIYAQSPCGKLIIQDIPANTFFIKTAREILADLDLLAGFPSPQVAFMAMIAETFADAVTDIIHDLPPERYNEK